jgi:hypothetical protein
VNGLVEEKIFAGPGAVEHPDNAEQRGFSRARRTHDGDKFALLNFEIDAAQDEKLAAAGIVRFFEISELD